MKIKILIFLFFATLLIAGVAFAMPQFSHSRPLSEPATMLIVGAGLVGIASLGRKIFSDRF